MKEVVLHPAHGRFGGRLLRGVTLASLLAMLVPFSLAAQGLSVVRRAIVTTCGSLPDPEKAAVVAGVVTDSISGVALPEVEVKLEWKDARGKSKSAKSTTTGGGFFAFCNVPGGVTATLLAHLLVTKGPYTLRIQPGELYTQHVRLPLSTITKPGILVGRVVDAKTRDPLEGVTVRLVERGDATVTNDHGYFSFGKQPFGIYTLEATRVGYEGRKAPVRVAGNFTENAEIDLSQKPIELRGLRVSVRPRYQRFDLDGLVRRMSLGVGQFITRDVLERRPHARITDLLRATPGVTVFVNHDDSYSLLVRGRHCAPDVFIDGVYYLDSDNSMDIPSAADLEAIEIYKGASEIPGIYLRPNPLKPACAVIAAWTRVPPGEKGGFTGPVDTAGR